MDATMEAKMGLPPPYEADRHHQPPPPPAYSAAPPPPTAPVDVPAPLPPPRTVVVGAPPAKLGPGPTGLPCPHCRASVVTNVQYTPNTKTHIVAAVLCVVAGCCLPYCMRSCQAVNHYCPNCKAFIGTSSHS